MAVNPLPSRQSNEGQAGVRAQLKITVARQMHLYALTSLQVVQAPHYSTSPGPTTHSRATGDAGQMVVKLARPDDKDGVFNIAETALPEIGTTQIEVLVWPLSTRSEFLMGSSS